MQVKKEPVEIKEEIKTEVSTQEENWRKWQELPIKLVLFFTKNIFVSLKAICTKEVSVKGLHLTSFQDLSEVFSYKFVEEIVR